jgi:PKD repeat protein
MSHFSHHLCLSYLLIISSTAICQSHYKALFIGNSYTYVNDLPAMTAALALSAGDTLTYDGNTPGGYTLSNHTTNATTLSKIEEGIWDFVVLQEQSQKPAFPQAQVEEEVFPYAAWLDSAVLAANPCAETVFYMTWGRKNGDAGNCQNWPPVCTYEGMDDLLRERYMQMALDNQAMTSPVGAVWRYIRTNNESIELYQTDESHPSVAGTYAAACCFYTTLFRKSANEITDNQGLDPDQAAYIRNAVDAVVYADLITWHIGTYDINAEFAATWLSSNTIQCTPAYAGGDYMWDFGDGTYSSEPAPTHTYANSGVYNVSLTVTNCGISAAQTMEVSSNTYQNEAQQIANDYWVFPNPCHNYINLQGRGQVTVTITDISGRQVAKQLQLQLPHQIDVSTWGEGFYFVQDVLQPADVKSFQIVH